MFIHRPEMLGVSDDTTYPGFTQLIIAKHRNGEVTDVNMRFLASEVRFVDENDGAKFEEPLSEENFKTYDSAIGPDSGFDNETSPF